MSKAKLAPHPAHTVPHLELCAAVLAAEMADTICSEMDTEIYAVRFFTDCRIVLGYIHNTSRRFHMYVANRVNCIRKSSQPQQWQYVATKQNPADHATRPMSVDILRTSNILRARIPEKQSLYKATVLILLIQGLMWKFGPKLLSATPKLQKVSSAQHALNNFLAGRDLPRDERHPVILPKTHITTLIVRHYHEEVVHQGRHLTEGAVWSAGVWIVG